MLIGQNPLKSKAVTSGYFPNDEAIGNNEPEIELNDLNNECNTQTFKMKLMAPAGEKVSLVSFLYLPSNNLLILSNSIDNNGQTNGWLTTMQNDGTIINHQKLLLEGNTPVELFEGNCNLSGKITLSGKVSGGSTQYFVTQLSAINYSTFWTRRFTHTNTVDEVAIGIILDTCVSFAARSGNDVQFGLLNKNGGLEWSRTFSHSSMKNLVGIEGSYSGNIPLILAINVTEGSKKRVLLISHENANGNYINAHFAGDNSNDEYSATDIKSFNDRVILTGNYFESASSSQKLFRHILGGTNAAETVHNYDGAPTVHDNTILVMSVAGEWLSWVPDKQEAVAFIKHAAYYQIGPQRGGIIEVPEAKHVKAVAAMNDGGYLMGINVKDESAIYLVKTDSIGRIAECNTQSFVPGYVEVIGANNVNTNYSASSFTIPSVSNFLQLLSATISTNFECKGLFCPPTPVADTCLTTYYKVYRSNSYVSSFGFSFEVNNDIAITTFRYSQLAGGLNSVTSSLKLYDKQGNFKSGVRYLYNGQPLDPVVFPLNKSKFIAYFYLPPLNDDSIRYMVALMDSQLQPVWTRWISMKDPSPFYSGLGYFADATSDEEGNIYLMGTTIGFMENPRITIHKLSSQGNAVWTSSVAVEKTNLISARIKAEGNNLVIIAEGGSGGSVSLSVNKNTGDPINAFLFNNVSGGLLYRRTLEWSGDRFLYIGNDKDAKFIMASFDITGKPIRIRRINNSGYTRSGDISNGHLYSTYTFFNGSNTKEVLLKADSNLNLIYGNEFELERLRTPIGLHVQDNEEILVPGNFVYGGANGYYVDPYIRKYDADGALGTCTNTQIINTLTDVDPKTEAINAIRVPQFISTYPGIEITVVPHNEGERVAEILCKSTNLCNTLSINGPTSLCQTNETISITTTRNAGCLLPVNWLYDTTAIQVVNHQDDSIQVLLKRNGSHLIVARIFTGCTMLEDSLIMLVSPATNTISLGPDTTLCPGDSMLLTAGVGFPGYQWSTGSTDSTLWVSAAGKYFVKVDNTCGAPLSDTIEVFMPSVPVLSAGADSSVCMGQPFQRLASDGFASYQWRDISSQQIVSGQKQLSVTAMAGTRYALEAVTDNGCKRYDTLTLQVISARPLDLGTNVNICTGDTVVFSAPADYAAYLWNTGETTTELKAWQQGIYKLTVTDNNGCKTSDSAAITTVFALPQPALGPDQSVCTGSSILLNPGTFARYQWHNGSTQSTFSAFANGMYAVQVWDANGCTKADTMQILAQLPLPTGFLAGTDSICQYEKLELKSNSVYRTYLWSNGSTQPALQVDKPGMYSLKVTDNNHCTGTDTVRVIQKICMEGVYVPNAFTPNNDRINDVFRPMVFGIAVRYEFSVYNRFGERMFVTNDVLKGWDGMYKGQPMPANAYAWMCTYHLEGGEAKVERGMVTLIR